MSPLHPERDKPAGGDAPEIALRYRLARRDTIARTGEPGTCLWCGRKLRASSGPFAIAGHRGDYADNAFCALRCGYSFGVWAARLGFRLAPRSDAQGGGS